MVVLNPPSTSMYSITIILTKSNVLTFSIPFFFTSQFQASAQTGGIKESPAVLTPFFCMNINSPPPVFPVCRQKLFRGLRTVITWLPAPSDHFTEKKKNMQTETQNEGGSQWECESAGGEWGGSAGENVRENMVGYFFFHRGGDALRDDRHFDHTCGWLIPPPQINLLNDERPGWLADGLYGGTKITKTGWINSLLIVVSILRTQPRPNQSCLE